MMHHLKNSQRIIIAISPSGYKYEYNIETEEIVIIEGTKEETPTLDEEQKNKKEKNTKRNGKKEHTKKRY